MVACRFTCGGVDLVGHRGVSGYYGMIVCEALFCFLCLHWRLRWSGAAVFEPGFGAFCWYWGNVCFGAGAGCWVLGYHSMGFGTFLIFPNFLRLSWFVPQLVVQLVYTMFISNNLASFRLWWNQNLLKHQKLSKYENDCSLMSYSKLSQKMLPLGNKSLDT